MLGSLGLRCALGGGDADADAGGVIENEARRARGTCSRVGLDGGGAPGAVGTSVGVGGGCVLCVGVVEIQVWVKYLMFGNLVFGLDIYIGCA